MIGRQVPGDKQPVDACTIIEAELGRREVPVAGETEFPGGVQVTLVTQPGD